MKKRIKEIDEKEIKREEVIEKQKLEYEEKRLKFKERTREGNILMSIELEKELTILNKEREDLKSRVSNLLALSKEANTSLLNLKEVFNLLIFVKYG